MNPLVQKLIDQADIDEATAGKVVGVVADFLDEKLPSPIDKAVSKALGDLDSDDLDGALDAVKGLFGGFGK